MNASVENILRAGIPSRSALRVAILRAVHQLLDEPPMFEDPVALPMLGKQAEEEVCKDPFQYNDPLSRGIRASLVARSRFAEEMLGDAVSKGVRQYVVLGAGLDTFGWRNPYAGQGLQVYEVDHPATQAWKKSLVSEAGLGDGHAVRFVACDFEKDSLGASLREAGFQADEPVCFSWLGVTVYLPKEAVFETLRFVASLPKGSMISFDYRLHPSLLNPIERMIGEHLAAHFAEQGEPWVSAFDAEQFREELREVGFQDIDDIGPVELNARYFAGRKDGLQTGGGFRLICARN